jgi:hypothetical protein
VSVKQTGKQLTKAMAEARRHQVLAIKANKAGDQREEMRQYKWANHWSQRAIELTRQLDQELKDSRAKRAAGRNRPKGAEREET